MQSDRAGRSAASSPLRGFCAPARLCVGLVCALCGAVGSSTAQVPELTVFICADTLACEMDGSGLFSEERSERLTDGYPLSFTLQVSLRRDRSLQLDPDLAIAQARLRITRQKLDERITLELNDFAGRTLRAAFVSLEELLLELDDRLYVPLMHLHSLPQRHTYYIEIEVAYQTLTFDDLRSAEAWLRGTGAETDSIKSAPRSAGDVALSYLWDLAGMRAQKERTRTSKFRLGDLRTID